jgi:hypothetical protein
MRIGAAVAGLAMVTAAAFGASGAAVAAVAVAGVLALLGVAVPRLSPVAVLATIGVLALGTPSLGASTLAGLAAIGYLLALHADLPAVQPFTSPTMLGIAGFTVVAAAAGLLPVAPTWLPVVVPVLVVVLYAGALAAVRSAAG